MLAWFLYTYIQYFIHFESGATPIQIKTSLKAVTVALAVVQACSLALFIAGPAELESGANRGQWQDLR
jgi:hypothetical protein